MLRQQQMWGSSTNRFGIEYLCKLLNDCLPPESKFEILPFQTTCNISKTSRNDKKMNAVVSLVPRNHRLNSPFKYST